MIKRINIQRYIASIALLVLIPFIAGARSCNDDINLGVNHGTAGAAAAGSGGNGGAGSGGRRSNVGGTAKGGAGGAGGAAGTCDDPRDCGRMPGYIPCSDGSVIVPVCKRSPNSGECDWTWDSCPTANDKCGGCSKNYYCEETDCGKSPQTPKCIAIPQECFNRGYKQEPVCGCDGIPYRNDCEAFFYNVSVDPRGECQKDPGGWKP